MFSGETSRWTIPIGRPRSFSMRVGVVEPLQDLVRDVGDHLGARRAAVGGETLADDPAEVAPLDVLLGQEELILPAAEVVHRDDVRVMERGQQVGLVAKLRDGVGIGRQLGPQPLDHHRAAKAPFAGGDRRVDLGHPAQADAIDQRVAADDGDRPGRRHLDDAAPSSVVRRASRKKLPIASASPIAPGSPAPRRAAAARPGRPLAPHYAGQDAEPAGERQRGHRHAAVDPRPPAPADRAPARAVRGRRSVPARRRRRRWRRPAAGGRRRWRPRPARARRSLRGCRRRAPGSPPAPASPMRPVSATGAAETAITCPCGHHQPGGGAVRGAARRGPGCAPRTRRGAAR